MNFRNHKGMTLIEITVVLLILIALAGLVMPYMGGTGRKVLCDATDVTMANLKRVIMDRYFLDTLGAYPTDKAMLTTGTPDYSLHYLMAQGGWQDFDLDTQVGWRGPYLQGGLVLGGGEFNAAKLDSSFKDVIGPFDPDTDHVHLNFADGQTVVLDAWGRPIVLQVHSNYGARLLSAGFGTGLGLSNAVLDTVVSDDRQADDRVLHLSSQTPAADINPSCGD